MLLHSDIQGVVKAFTLHFAIVMAEWGDICSVFVCTHAMCVCVCVCVCLCVSVRACMCVRARKCVHECVLVRERERTRYGECQRRRVLGGAGTLM